VLFRLFLRQCIGKGISISAPRFGERSEPERGAEMVRRRALRACRGLADLVWLERCNYALQVLRETARRVL